MSISIRPLRGAFAGEVSGLSLAIPIDRSDVAAIEAGMDAYAVLVFRDQPLTDEQQIAFTLNFGELLAHLREKGHAELGSLASCGPVFGPFTASSHNS